MKFKKVEISAFRIYDKPEDATFDFSVESGKTANFVSLYAPNGFGKTSFYDAVEWGVTKTINRFLIRNKELKKLADYQYLENDTSLIRNNKSNLDTYVKIYLDGSEEVLHSVFKKHGNQKHDVNFDNPVIEKRGFQNVILSQEWISAFLKEVNGERRYETFMDNPDLQEIDDYYKNVKTLTTVCWERISELEVSIAADKQKVEDLNEGNLLERVNAQISFLEEEYDEKFNYLTLSTTKKEVLDFKDLVSSKIISYRREAKIGELLDDVTLAIVGDDETIGINKFFELKESIKDLSKEIERVTVELGKFDQLKSFNAELKNILAFRKQLSTEKEVVGGLIGSFYRYKQIEGIINQKSEERTKNEQNLIELNLQQDALKRKEAELREHLETTIKQISDLEDEIEKIPVLVKNFSTLNSETKRLEKLIKDEGTKVEEGENKRNVIKGEIIELRKIIEEVHLGKYSSLVLNEEPSLFSLLKELEAKDLELAKLKSDLDGLNFKIEEQQTLNSAIEEFIKKGLAIVNESQASSCPLCENTFDSYSQLAYKISNNTALDNALQDLLTERNNLNQRISKLLKENKESKDTIVDFYNKKLDNLLQKEREFLKDLDDLRGAFGSYEANLREVKERLSEYNLKMNGVSIEEYANQLQASLNEFRRSRKESSEQLLVTTGRTTELSGEIKSVNTQIELINKEIKGFVEDKKYSDVLKWFKNEHPESAITEITLIDKINDLSDRISISSLRLFEVESEIENLEKELNSLSKEELILQKNEWKARKGELHKNIDSYTHFLYDKLNIDLSKLEKETLLEILKQKEKEQKRKIERAKRLGEEYEKLEKFSENLLPYLQAEIVKLQIKKNEEDLEFLTKKTRPLLEEEKEKVKIYLDKKVKGFFYEELINNLYNKIDPHPDFKTIEFKANFDSDNPRLDIFVVDSKNNERLIPNLYFSSAQINILSLSIFLASALNSKEYDCIFIDDPIQSMDSINVLSTIDLLRSIVVNESKQIIISTHDENFHNLLKKKMPPKLFNSKFLELETFGKVKRDK
jgi:exonuclease SbcC